MAKTSLRMQEMTPEIELLKATKRSVEQIKKSQRSTRDKINQIESSIAEIKKDGKKNSRYFWIPLVSVIIGGLITFGASYYFQFEQAKKDRQIAIQQLYGEINYHSFKYIQAWYGYYGEVMKWEYASNFGYQSSERSNTMVTADQRCSEYLDIMGESESQVEKNYNLLRAYVSTNSTTDSLKNEMFSYQDDTFRRDIRNTPYDTIMAYGRRKFDTRLLSDYHLNLRPKMEAFIESLSQLSPEFNVGSFLE